MASSRRLQAEIDRVLKRISDGINEFNVAWDKVQNASSQNLKEKYEADLKKDIKKLQKYRDQVKTWAGSNDVKNKQPLLDARRSIEREMERFKVLEREMKTKAYSKEGLSQSRSRKKVDPTTDPRYPTYQWIQSIVDDLEEQRQTLDDSTEGLRQQSKRGKNKAVFQKKLDDALHWMERHSWHLEKLEDTRRRLEKKELTIDQVEEIKEDVEYYRDSNQDPDFFDDQYLYEILDEPVEVKAPEPSASESDDADEPAPVVDKKTKVVPPPQPSMPLVSANQRILKAPKSPSKGDKKNKEVKNTNLNQDKNTTNASLAASSASSPSSSSMAATTTPPGLRAQGSSNPTPSANPQQRRSGPSPVSPLSHTNQSGTTLASILRNGGQSSSHNSSMPSSSDAPGQSALDLVTQQGRGTFSSHPSHPSGINPQAETPQDYHELINLIQPSMQSLPEPMDSERPKQYVPRNPYRTPAYFPSQPASLFDEPAIFEKFATDTLFFIFYFQQGTPHQYLAARELKKQSWRYHKNFLTWFQRHDDPKLTTDEFEEGTYVFFDYEAGWCQRIKTDFTFEYQHLEDEFSVPMASTL